MLSKLPPIVGSMRLLQRYSTVSELVSHLGGVVQLDRDFFVDCNENQCLWFSFSTAKDVSGGSGPSPMETRSGATGSPVPLQRCFSAMSQLSFLIRLMTLT